MTLNKLIAFALKQRFFVIGGVLTLIGAGLFALTHLPFDAFPDLTIICPAGRVAFLEVKSLRDSRAKNPAHWQRQEDTRATLARMGHLVAVVTDQDQAVETLRGWGVIR